MGGALHKWTKIGSNIIQIVKDFVLALYFKVVVAVLWDVSANANPNRMMFLLMLILQNIISLYGIFWVLYSHDFVSFFKLCTLCFRVVSSFSRCIFMRIVAFL